HLLLERLPPQRSGACAGKMASRAVPTFARNLVVFALNGATGLGELRYSASCQNPQSDENAWNSHTWSQAVLRTCGPAEILPSFTSRATMEPLVRLCIRAICSKLIPLRNSSQIRASSWDDHGLPALLGRNFRVRSLSL